MEKNMWLYLFFITIMAMSFTGVARASGGGDKEAIHIKSNQMEALDKEGKVIFTGDVVARKGDLTIYADRLIVYYSDKKGGAGAEGKRSLERLVAEGDVKITQGKRTARGDEATYDKKKEIITLTGDAQVWQGQNRVKGDKIIVFLKEDKSIVESGPNGRVEAVVFTNTGPE